MPNRNLKNLQDIGEASQLVNDFKFVKNAYFDLKGRQRALIAKDQEIVDGDYWEDENFEEEIKLFDQRKKHYSEAQKLYRELKTKLDH
ncbi:MAG TPA: hypothetical protein VGA99_12615 [bacterium]